LQFKTFRLLAKGITTFEKMKDYTYVPLATFCIRCQV
jgi:hypothetical protein